MPELPLDYDRWCEQHRLLGAQRQAALEEAIEWMLAGSYNERGRRAWYERPRAQLAGRTPRQALADGDEREVYELARALVALGVA